MNIRRLFPLVLCALLLLVACHGKKASVTDPAGDLPATRTLRVGDMTVLALLDKAGPASARLFPDLDQFPERKAAFEQDASPAVSRTYVVRKGQNLVLIDSGWGLNDNGRTMSLLAANGIEPAAITHVILTHLDGDHVAGLLDAQGKAAFANATLHVSKVEMRAWQSGHAELVAKRPKAKLDLARRVLAAYKGRIKHFKHDAAVLPGIVPVEARGHTPGHTAIDLTGRDAQGRKQGLTIVGDLIHHAGVQLRWPSYCAVYDCNPKLAAMVREGLLARAARTGIPVAGMHFAAIGRVEALPGGGYRIVDGATQ